MTNNRCTPADPALDEGPTISTEPQTEVWPISEPNGYVVRRDTLVGEPAPDPFPPQPPDRRIGAGMLLGLGAFALVAAGIAVAWLLTHRGRDLQATTVVITTAPATAAPAVAKVLVPRLVGLEERQALVRLGQQGLRPREVFRPTKQAKGVVVSQKPLEATRLRKGSQVTLVIDSGAPKIALPSLIGRPFAEAQARLDSLGLDSTKTEATSDHPPGIVIDQAPKVGAKLAKGSLVTLSVARARTTTAQATTPQATTAGTTTAQATAGQPTTSASTAPATTAPATPPQPQTATVPDLGGQTEPSAVQALGRAGILASLFFVPNQDPLGTVEQQAKPAGTTVPYHSHVQVNISQGPGEKEVEQMPDVIGKTLDQAVAAVNAAHLRLIYLKIPVTSRAQAGKIVQQSPLAGGRAPKNAQVLVFLGAYRVR